MFEREAVSDLFRYLGRIIGSGRSWRGLRPCIDPHLVMEWKPEPFCIVIVKSLMFKVLDKPFDLVLTVAIIRVLELLWESRNHVRRGWDSLNNRKLLQLDVRLLW